MLNIGYISSQTQKTSSLKAKMEKVNKSQINKTENK